MTRINRSNGGRLFRDNSLCISVLIDPGLISSDKEEDSGDDQKPFLFNWLINLFDEQNEECEHAANVK